MRAGPRGAKTCAQHSPTFPRCACLPGTAVLGAYGHGVFGALQTLAPAEAARFGGLRERLRVIRVKRVIIATGALERLVAFPGNDLPGVMLAGAALAYLRRYGVAVGQPARVLPEQRRGLRGRVRARRRGGQMRRRDRSARRFAGRKARPGAAASRSTAARRSRACTDATGFGQCASRIRAALRVCGSRPTAC